MACLSRINGSFGGHKLKSQASCFGGAALPCNACKEPRRETRRELDAGMHQKKKRARSFTPRVSAEVRTLPLPPGVRDLQGSQPA